MATAAAAVMAKARRDVLSHFLSADAMSAANAVPYDPGRRVRRRQFERLIAARVIRDSGKGTYWIDAPAFDEWSRDRRRRVGLALGALTAIGAALAMVLG